MATSHPRVPFSDSTQRPTCQSTWRSKREDRHAAFLAAWLATGRDESDADRHLATIADLAKRVAEGKISLHDADRQLSKRLGVKL